jgi:hypothetical protein
MALINTLNEIGDAIREKTGNTELIPLKEMADVILSISGGESVGYSSITYNEDDTVTLTETNGAIRTMTCEYDGDKLVGLKCGNEVINLTYEDDTLVGIGGMEVDVSNAPADTRLKDFIEGTLTELVDDTITVVGTDVLYGNKQIQKVSLPNCVKLNKLAFDNCSKLTNVYLPNCATVGENAFYGCKALERIDLPSVTNIGIKAFYGCNTLSTLIIRTNQVVPAGATYLFEGSPIKKGTGYIYVPDNLVEDYKVATTWSTYADQIKGLSELEVVSNE